MGGLTLKNLILIFFLLFYVGFTQGSFSSTLKSLIDEQASRSPNLGIYVKNLTTGEVVASYNSNRLFIPASNQKIITTLGSLHFLGKDYKFKTIFFIPVKPNQTGIYNQNLYIDTKGDPTLKTDDLIKVVSYLGDKGIKTINGDIVLNDNYFEKPYYNPNWKESWKGVAWAPYISSIAINDNLYSSKNTIYLTDNPLYLLGVKFKKELRRQQIKFNGTVRFAQIPISKKLTPFKIKYEIESARLGEIVEIINKTSNNLYAEHLFKKLSANFSRVRGSWQDSQVIFADFLTRNVDLNTRDFNINDGSGLSSKNKISTKGMVQILEFATKQDYFYDFYESLPVAGLDGTLIKRFKKYPLYKNLKAKTGYIRGVSSLSGYFNGKDNDVYVFSFIVNNYNFSIRLFIDEVLRKIYYL